MAGKAKEPGPSSTRVAANLRRIRQRKGMSTAQLSRRLRELGQPIPDTGITKIEKGVRRVDVDDLVALAVALEVTPNALLLPEMDTPHIASAFYLTPREEEGRPGDLWAWATGELPLGSAGASAASSEKDRTEEAGFVSQNRPHHLSWPGSYVQRMAEQAEDILEGQAGEDRIAANAALGVAVFNALEAGLTTAEIRNVMEAGLIVGLTTPVEELYPRIKDVAEQLRIKAAQRGVHSAKSSS
jgi:transcriptional regulator with XRE-family HTH domain